MLVFVILVQGIVISVALLLRKLRLNLVLIDVHEVLPAIVTNILLAVREAIVGQEFVRSTA